MAPAIMGTKLKKVRVFIDKYGQTHEGTIEQNLGQPNLGRTTEANRLAEETGDAQTTENK